MPLLIATDEAGYGPRLGPLVIVATAWRLQPGASFESAHQRLSQPIHIGAIGELRVDDSKRLFSRKKSCSANPPSPSALDLLTDAAAAWTSMPSPSEDYRQWLLKLAPDDLQELGRQPWFASLASAPSASGALPQVLPTQSLPAQAATCHAAEVSQTLIGHWSGGGLHLVGIAARIIDAARFNRLLDTFANKADLLSHMTCELAIKLWQQHRGPAAAQTHIYSDRHGGRAYYGGLLQHHCPDLNMRVIRESALCSCYRLSAANVELSDSASGSIQWAFTVGGDSYPPVAFSSIIAKSTRERLMERFNGYFQTAVATSIAPGGMNPLRPTAGYATDAARFLQDILPLRIGGSLDDAILIRRK